MSDSVKSITALLHQTADEMKRLVDPSLTIGQPRVIEGATVIPISKASFGVAGGGADGRNGGFNGGVGGKAELTPLSFLVIQNGQVQVLAAEAVAAPSGVATTVVNAATEAVSELVQLGKERKKAEKVKPCKKS